MLLNLEAFRLRFWDAPPDEYAVDGIDLSLSEGEILGLVGESGSGKTATAMSICGLLTRQRAELSGKLTLDGVDLLNAPEAALRSMQGRVFSVVFQEPMTSLDPLMRVGKQVEEGLRVHAKLSRAQRRQLALEAMAQADLPEPEALYRRYPHELSGGQLQRIMIAAAIVTHPKLLIADEPTTALDVTAQSQILELLQRLNREQHMAILFISHNLQVVRRLCSTAAVMKDGKIVERGATDALFRSPQHPYTQRLIAAIPKRPEV